jgi:hypothetical protein
MSHISLPPIRYWQPVFVYRPVKRCIGHTVDRGQEVEAFGESDHSLGVFSTTEQAIAAIHRADREAHPEHLPPNLRHLPAERRSAQVGHVIYLSMPVYLEERNWLGSGGRMPVPILDDIISYGKVAWGVVRYLWRWARRNRRNLTPQQKLELRARWKPPVESWLLKHNREKLRHDCIVRDMKRIDEYPNAKKGRGISAWFRVSLIDTYERGLMVGLRIEGLVEESSGWRLGDYENERDRMVNMVLTGFIPCENIEMIDWDGDDYYPYPHIYCYFDFKGEPYERLAYCENGTIDEHIIFYKEIAKYHSVLKLTKKLKGKAWLKRIH